MTFEDYLAIKNLIHGYPRCTDKGDFDGVGRVLGNANSGFRDRVPLFKAEGPEAFTAMYKESVRKYPDRGTPKCRHLIGNVIIEPDGSDAANAESYVVVFQQTDELPLQAIIAGTYFDRFEKKDGKWQLTERWEDMELVGDLSAHLLKPIEDSAHGH